MLQPLASAVPSFRPLMTNNAWTPPSRLPFGLYLKRASRTGPLRVMNEGTVLSAPKAVATATSGFTAGLVPPVGGWGGEPTQPSGVERGARPSPGPAGFPHFFYPGGEEGRLGPVTAARTPPPP